MKINKIRILLGTLTAITLALSVFLGPDIAYNILVGDNDRILTGEDCNWNDRFQFGFGKLEYYPENETALLEINYTENVPKRT